MSGVANCNKCGICLSVCPVYAVMKEEQNSPRARIHLAEIFGSGKLAGSKLLKDLLSRCLMCGSCGANCPSGIDHGKTFMEMRAALIAELGDRPEIRSLVYLLAKEQRLRLAVGAARLGQAIVPRLFQEKYRLGNIAVRDYPRLNRKPFRDEVGEVIEPQGELRGEVIYFTGCGTNYIFGETGHAGVRLLGRLGFRVIIPRRQTCCSIPMLFHGGIDRAKDNIMTNIDCLQHETAQAVLVDCPTCGMALREEFPALMRRYGLDDRAALDIAAKTCDLTAFVAEHVAELEFDSKERVKVCYHQPCHLKNSGLSSEALVESLPGVDYVRLENSGDCCGGGGTFFYEYPEVAARIGEAKLMAARSSGATVWLTDCPVCRINLGGQLLEEDNIVMTHPLTFLAGRLGGRG